MPPAQGRLMPLLRVPLTYSDFQLHSSQCRCFGLQKALCPSSSGSRAGLPFRREVAQAWFGGEEKAGCCSRFPWPPSPSLLPLLAAGELRRVVRWG